MNNEILMYSEIKLARYQQRQKIKPKSKSSSISDTEQKIIYVELLRNASRDHQEDDKDSHCNEFPSSPEKLIAAILGIICLVLMTAVITMTIIINISSPVKREQNNSSLITGSQKGCNFSYCPKSWFIYSNNCYYMSIERKTWNESWMTCASKKSNLLYIENEEEMHFMSSLNVLSWIDYNGSSKL
ncbi:NKG2-A/NKG2-B type II integral membrane protein-like [Tenrec ecaudatus]|uniref:NKG2-A/NKG2-B type II integral membrane protein-like n=1 Tax=Tenrec ecaudatus TaxID=94439 RepID=UPI003F59A220